MANKIWRDVQSYWLGKWKLKPHWANTSIGKNVESLTKTSIEECGTIHKTYIMQIGVQIHVLTLKTYLILPFKIEMACDPTVFYA